MTNERFTLNAKVLNQLQETLLTSKKHVEFLAANAPEIRTNLQSIAETLETVVSVLENQIYFNRDNAAIVEKLNGEFELEKACKNQAYDFILTERLLNRFKLFCSCYPVSTYNEKTVLTFLQST
jgi:hypothetical protein